MNSTIDDFGNGRTDQLLQRHEANAQDIDADGDALFSTNDRPDHSEPLLFRPKLNFIED